MCHFRTKKSGNLWTQLKNLYFWGGGITVVHVQNESLHVHSLLFPAATTTMSVPWSDGFERDKITRTALISAEKTIFMVNPFPDGIPGSSPFWPFAGKWPLIRRARHIWDFECVYMCIEGGPAHARELVQSNRDKNRLCSKTCGIDTNDEKDELDPNPGVRLYTVWLFGVAH